MESISISSLHNLAGMERVDRRRMDDLREVLCIDKCLVGRLAKSRVKWGGGMWRDCSETAYEEWLMSF